MYRSWWTTRRLMSQQIAPTPNSRPAMTSTVTNVLRSKMQIIYTAFQVTATVTIPTLTVVTLTGLSSPNVLKIVVQV